MSVLLQREYKFYLDHLREFMPGHLNQFVLIKEDNAVDFFNSYEEALKCGLEKFGNVPFFLRVIREVEETHFFQQGLSR